MCRVSALSGGCSDTKSDSRSSSSSDTRFMPSSFSASGLRRGLQYRSRMPNPRARRAVARPMRPPPPTRPMVLPYNRLPARWFDCEPGNLPARTRRSPSTRLRATAIISPICRSAVASATIGGTTVTAIPRRVASATSILSGVIDIEAIAFSPGFAASTARSILSCSSENRMSHFFTAAISRLLGRIRLASALTLTSAMARSRASALGAIGCVTNTRGLGLTAATARCRPRRRPRIVRRREWRASRRARPAPWECRARARARQDARSSRRVRPPRRPPAAARD